MFDAEAFEDGTPVLLWSGAKLDMKARDLVIAHERGTHGALHGAFGANLPLAPLALKRGLPCGHEFGDHGKPGSGLLDSRVGADRSAACRAGRYRRGCTWAASASLQHHVALTGFAGPGFARLAAISVPSG